MKLFGGKLPVEVAKLSREQILMELDDYIQHLRKEEQALQGVEGLSAMNKRLQLVVVDNHLCTMYELLRFRL